MEKKYKVVNGTSYHENTPEAVIRILDEAMRKRSRIRIWYGDATTGRDWMEVHDTIGTIGRSCGNIKIPLLLCNRRSLGGMAVLDNCIVKIAIDKKVVYQHEKYHLPIMEIREADNALKKEGYMYSVFADGNIIHNWKTLKQAENVIAFHKGTRNKVA